MKPLAECRLYTFIDTAYMHGRSPAELANLLCDGGSDLIQIRAKSESPDFVARMVDEVLPITNAAGVHLVVNDHLDVARKHNAGWCHLGQEDFFDAGGHTHIDQLNRGTISIGLSSHAPDQAQRAIAAGAHYVAIGPVYATGTKPTAKPVTLSYVEWAAKHIQIPWFAIGGINLQNLDQVLEAGARRICVVSAILNAPDIAKACQDFKIRLPIIPTKPR